MNCYLLRTIAWLVFICSSTVLGEIVINEIHYDADPKTAPIEFVEHYNGADKTENLGGWYYSNGIDFNFAENTKLKPDDYLIIAENPVGLLAQF